MRYMNDEISTFTEEQCRSELQKINRERMLVAFVCGFVTSRAFKMSEAVQMIEDDNFLMFLTFLFILHNSVFCLLLIQFHEEQKTIRERLIEIRGEKHDKN